MADPRAQVPRVLERLLAIEATDLRAAMSEAAQILIDVFAADKIDLSLHDEARDLLVALGVSDTPMGRKQQALGLDHLPASDGGRVGWIFRTGEPFLDGHVDRDPVELPGFKEDLGVRSTIGSPIVVDGRIVGVLSANSTRREAFSPGDLDFLVAAGRWVGLVAHRAQLLEEAADEAARREQARLEGVLLAVRTLQHGMSNQIALVVGLSSLLVEDERIPANLQALAYDARAGAEEAVALVNRLRDMTRLATADLGGPGAIIDLSQSVDLSRSVEQRAG